MPGAGALYEHPRLYEQAFAFRDVAAEVDAVEGWYSRRHPGRPGTALELAAGPGAHGIELARRGTRVTTLDRSPTMCDYARRRAAEEAVTLDVTEGDMVRFRLPRRRFDLALCMCDSASHLLDVDAMVAHLRTVASHLVAGGLYVVEMSHPVDVPTGLGHTQDRWRITHGGRRLDVRWTTPRRAFDPDTRVGENRISVTVTENGRRRVLRDRLLLRRWAATEFDAAVRLAGKLALVGRHGSFDVDAAFGRGRGEWRMISVLERQSG